MQKLATAELWSDRVNAAKGLGRVSNAKLVRLHDTLTDAKKRFGSRDKLIGSIVELNKRVKDKGFAAKLAAYPLPQLLDLHAAATRKSKRAEDAAKAKPAKAEKPKGCDCRCCQAQGCCCQAQGCCQERQSLIRRGGSGQARSRLLRFGYAPHELRDRARPPPEACAQSPFSLTNVLVKDALFS